MLRALGSRVDDRLILSLGLEWSHGFRMKGSLIEIGVRYHIATSPILDRTASWQRDCQGWYFIGVGAVEE